MSRVLAGLTAGLVASGLLVVTACNGATPTAAPAVDTPQSPDDQRIVFVGPRFDVWTIRGDGDSLELLIGEGASDSPATLASLRPQQAKTVRYTWPTWSPDGERVALSRVPGLGENSVAGLVVVTGADSSTERQLHETRPRSVGLVAPGAPHYAHWAPNSHLLSFVAPRAPRRGLGLFSVDPEGGDLHQVAANAPLYHVWSPDGTLMLVHRREKLLLHDTRNRSTRDLDADSSRYRVPAFSPDGERIAYIIEEEGAGRLVTSNTDGSDRVVLMDIPGEAAFAWSPAGGRIAVATKQPSSLSYAELYVVDEDGSDAARMLAPGRMAAFYWSPDGERIARVAIADDGLAWQAVNPTTGGTEHLTSFTTTPDFLTHLQFFDQFAPSHLVWSADSTKLTFVGSIESGAEPLVWIVDATGSDAPRSVAEGRLAFWAPSSSGGEESE